MKIKSIIMIIVASILIYSSYDVNAATQITPTATYYSFRLCNINSSSYAESNCEWSTGTEVGTNTTPGSNLYATGFRVNMLFGNDTFETDNTYTITLKMAINKPQYFASILDSPLSSKSLDQSCLGTTGSNCSNANFKNISARVSNISGNTFDYIITFSPAIETKYFRFAVYNNNPLYNGIDYNQGELLYKAMTYGRLNGYNATYESGVGSIIENSTIIIQNQNNQIIDGQNQINNNLEGIKDTITGDYEYEDKPLEDIQGKEEIDEMKELEEGILGSIDLSATDTLDITINPEASKFIWDIVEELRGINTKIVMLITSILGLGIIKMILNR